LAPAPHGTHAAMTRTPWLPELALVACASQSSKCFEWTTLSQCRSNLFLVNPALVRTTKSDMKGLEVQKCLLQSAVASTAAPVAGLCLGELAVENTLGECLQPNGLLLLTKWWRDVSQGRGDANGLMERCLDGHTVGAATSTEATRSSRVTSVDGMDQMNG